MEGLLAENERKPRRERLTLIRLYEALRGLGYEGGYDAVRRHVRRWQREEAGRTATAFVPLSFDPREAYQFDRSHEVVAMAGVTTTVKVAHVRLCHGRMFFVAADPPVALPFGWQAHQITRSVHRGNYSGMAGRWVHLLSGLALIYLCVSGIAMYWEPWRRRQRAGGKPLIWR